MHVLCIENPLLSTLNPLSRTLNALVPTLSVLTSPPLITLIHSTQNLNLCAHLFMWLRRLERPPRTFDVSVREPSSPQSFHVHLANVLVCLPTCCCRRRPRTIVVVACAPLSTPSSACNCHLCSGTIDAPRPIQHCQHPRPCTNHLIRSPRLLRTYENA